jgi:chromosome segregation ATPase
MKKYLLIISIGIFASVLTLSCTSDKKKVENAQENVQDAKQNVQDAKENLAETTESVAEKNRAEWVEFKKTCDERIAKNEEEISKLRAKRKANKADQDKYNAKIDELQKQNSDIKAKLDNYKDTDGNPSNWEQFKMDVSHDFEKLEKDIKDLV